MLYPFAMSVAITCAPSVTIVIVHLTSFFKGHQIVSMKDLMEGTASIGQVTRQVFGSQT